MVVDQLISQVDLQLTQNWFMAFGRFSYIYIGNGVYNRPTQKMKASPCSPHQDKQVTSAGIQRQMTQMTVLSLFILFEIWQKEKQKTRLEIQSM